MDYYDRSQLPILSFEEETADLDYDMIREALCEKPCNIVLVEVKNRLFGIVSWGDISRAKKTGKIKVPINRSFTFLKGKQFMRAREIFREKEKIREIPVIDENGFLLGMCSRSDDLLYLEYRNLWKENRYVRPFLSGLKAVRIVRAPEADTRRRKVIDRWIEEFMKCGVVCEQIDFSEIPEKQKEKTPILVVDEETKLGAGAVIKALDGGLYHPDVVHTFRGFKRSMSDHAYDELIGKLADSGIKIYNMYYTNDKNTEGRRRLWAGMRKFLENPELNNSNPYVVPSCAQGFYGELNTGSYAVKVGRMHFDLYANNIYTCLTDTKSRYFNVVNGERVTVGQPEEAERTIWFFGPCFVIGGLVEDKYTIESILQERLNREGYSCRVVNCGCFESPYHRMARITVTPMKPGDIMVIHVENRPFEGTESIDMMELLDRNNVPTEWLLDLPVHCNHKVNKIYADDLFERMVRGNVLTGEVKEGQRTMLSRALAVNSLYLDLYFNDFRPEKGMVVGSIDIHGNPFTLGHRYLIETASKQVDRLFVLLIEDDLGIFSYAERFAMAVEGTQDLQNVKIVPGGPFQATRNVFREYFVKVKPTDMRESATLDTLIFAEIIAKRLGITRRFLGDERHNPKMQFFNELMKEMFPLYGIEVIELPRAQAGRRAISASLARNATVGGDRETLLANIPETTLRFITGTDD